jgi:hypothetical protein
MDLDAQVQERLKRHMATSGDSAPCCSHKQFAALVAVVTAIAQDAEAGVLEAERRNAGSQPGFSAQFPKKVTDNLVTVAPLPHEVFRGLPSGTHVPACDVPQPLGIVAARPSDGL